MSGIYLELYDTVGTSRLARSEKIKPGNLPRNAFPATAIVSKSQAFR